MKFSVIAFLTLAVSAVKASWTKANANQKHVIEEHGRRVQEGQVSLASVQKTTYSVEVGLGRKLRKGTKKTGASSKGKSSQKCGKGGKSDDGLEAIQFREGEELILPVVYCPGECLTAVLDDFPIIEPCVTSMASQQWNIATIGGMPGIFTMQSVSTGQCIGIEETCVADDTEMVPCDSPRAMLTLAPSDMIFSWYCWSNGLGHLWFDPSASASCDVAFFFDDDGFYSHGVMTMDVCQAETLL